MWWKRKDNIKTVMVVEDGRKGRATTEIVLLMIERRRQHNRDSVMEENGRQ